MRTFMLTLLCLLLLIPAIMANTAYTQPGGGNSSYLNDPGIFADGLLTTPTGARGIGTLKGSPMFADFDGDSLKEIAVVHGSTVSFYEDKSLTPLTDFTLLNATDDGAYPIAYDIDGDGAYEVLVASHLTEPLVEIVKFNGTVAHQNASFRDSGNNHPGDGDVIINCKGTNDCLIVYVDHNAQVDYNTNKQGFYAHVFNSSQLHQIEGVYNRSDIGAQIYNYCMPTGKTMPAADIDGDGNQEYVLTAVEYGQSGVDNGLVLALQVTGNTATQDWYFRDTELDLFPFQNDWTCDTATSEFNVWNKITAPLVYDLYGASNQREVVYGYQADSSGVDFQMKMLSGAGAEIRQYPNVFQADGEIMSNVFLMNHMSESYKDFCILGREEARDELTMLCATEEYIKAADTTTGFSTIQALACATTGCIRSDEWFLPQYSQQALTNITNSRYVFHNMAHGSEQGFSEVVSDIISSYGVLSAPHTSMIDNNSLGVEFFNDYQSGLVLMIDANNTGFADMLVATSSQLYYIDDAWTNTPARITDITTNPCLNRGAIKANTSVAVFVEVQDYDAYKYGLVHKVRANSTFYAGDPVGETHLPYSAYGVSGSTFQFTFKANVSGLNKQLVVRANDDQEPSEVETQTINYDVGNVGFEYGENSCSVYSNEFVEIDEDTGEELITDGTGAGTQINNNSITNFLDEAEDLTGLGKGLFWLIIMAVVAFVPMSYALQNNKNVMHAGVVTLFIEFMFLMIGTVLGYISAILTTSILVVLFLVGIIYVRNKFTASDNAT